MSAAMFKVQMGVPIPAINRTPKGVRRKYPIDTMKVDGMFFVPGRSCKSVSAYISRISKDVEGKFSARQCLASPNDDGTWTVHDPLSDTPPPADAVQGTGVWRLE